MKKFIYFLTAALMLAGAAESMAQDVVYRQYRTPHPHHHQHYVSPAEGLGLHFGFAHSFYRKANKFSESVDSDRAKNGFHVGLTKDFTLIPYSLYIQTGLDYVFQAVTPDVPDFNKIDIIAKEQDHIMNIPVQLKYEYPLFPTVSLFAQVGPTVSFGLASNLRYRAQIDNDYHTVTYNYFNRKIKASNGAGAMKEYIESTAPEAKFRRFDMYLGGAVGAKFFEILEVSFGYDWGVVNQYKGEPGDIFRMRRQQFYLTAAVRF